MITNYLRGSNHAFGACDVVDCVVVQECAGEATLRAVGFNVRVTEPERSAELTVVL